MVRSFGVPETDIGFWVGITASSFSVAQCLTGIAWGRMSDRTGRKTVILCGIMGMLVSIVVFGFSNSIAMALVSRSCIGILNGNVGILHTMVAELVPEKELQPQAFSLLPLTWSIGGIFGPIMGGFLSEPAKKFPSLFPKDSFFDRHPFALPNLFTAAILFVAFIVGAFFLDETLVGQSHRYDPGREVGKKIEAFLSSNFKFLRVYGEEDVRKQYPIRTSNEETSSQTQTSTTYTTTKPTSTLPQPSNTHHTHSHGPLPWAQVLTKLSIYNIILYFLLAIHGVSYDSILPVFFSTAPPTSEDPISLPFHIPGGFGLSTGQIGLIYSANAVVTMLLQVLVYPPIARSYGSVRLLTWCAAIYPMIYLITPYTLAIPSVKGAYLAWSVIILCKSVARVFSFTSIAILITNTASSIRVLGTLNGFATSTAAMGGAIGPSIFGWMFSVGQKGMWTTIPWVGLVCVAGMMWFWIPMLQEGNGIEREESSESEYDPGEEIRVTFAEQEDEYEEDDALRIRKGNGFSMI
ncbi:hypothetical protein ABW20_dc0108232 [Dactylellina cionopaga]|nr:hypothetical protein ABW20_dc0108232 [Dactylellina cionopaga]